MNRCCPLHARRHAASACGSCFPSHSQISIKAAADGVIARLDIEREHDGSSHGGHYLCATFTYDFRDPSGHRVSGNCYQDFSSEADARDFAARELPIDKPVVVRFHPKNPSLNSLELDSWTYTNDRPTSLNI